MQTMLTRFDPFRNAGWAFGGPTPSMPMDVVRREDAVIVELDLPGVDPASIEATVERNVLMIAAERPFRELEGGQFIRRERPYGRFTRQIFLGDGLDTSRVEASYDSGVLTVVVPLLEEARPHRIAIEHGNGAQAISAAAQ